MALLRPSQGEPISTTLPIPDQFIDDVPVLQHEEILNQRISYNNGKPETQVLVKWKGRDLSEATWEPAAEMSDLEDKVHFEEGDTDTVRVTQEVIQTRPVRLRKRPARFDD